MKKQILTLIIGILIGAIITTGIFLIIKGNTGGQGDRMRGDMQEMDGNFQGRGSDSSRLEENNNRTNSNEQINNNSSDIDE